MKWSDEDVGAVVSCMLIVGEYVSSRAPVGADVGANVDANVGADVGASVPSQPHSKLSWFSVSSSEPSSRRSWFTRGPVLYMGRLEGGAAEIDRDNVTDVYLSRYIRSIPFIHCTTHSATGECSSLPTRSLGRQDCTIARTFFAQSSIESQSQHDELPERHRVDTRRLRMPRDVTSLQHEGICARRRRVVLFAIRRVQPRRIKALPSVSMTRQSRDGYCDENWFNLQMLRGQFGVVLLLV